MAQVVLFHHAQGLTKGVEAFADALREAGHTVHTPDLYAGRTFDTLEAGVAHAQEIGMTRVAELGVRSVAELPHELVYAGFSLGVMPAQELAQTRSGARGALFFHSCLPVAEFGSWPAVGKLAGPALPVQIHGMSDDPFFAGEGDLEAAEALVAAVDTAELFVYPGDQHLFADCTLPSYDAGATALLLQRTLQFLARIDG